MKIKVLGVQKMDYEYQGKTFKGVKCFAEDVSTESSNLQGHKCLDFKIRENALTCPLQVGALYNIYFNQYGQFDCLDKA